MLYLRLNNDSNNLIYYCRNCGNTYDETDKSEICVLNTHVSQSSAFSQDINEYTKYDQTLPRTKNIKCPNQSCKSNIGESIDQSPDQPEQPNRNEVIYLRYDDINLHYTYICAHCDTIWNTNT
jgi:DNA-directed RNA polymerase subunit M/transcription elongation factor TFIIS